MTGSQQKLGLEEKPNSKKPRLNNIKNIEYFDSGKRGIINIGYLGKKKVAIKTKKPSSEAVGRIANESKWLKELNKKKIGPKLVLFEKNSLVYEFVKGKFILDFIAHSNKKEIIKVLKEILEQCYGMDKIGVNKEEMHHPLKHVIIGKTNNKIKVTLIDFERVHETEKPKNVTQFLQFIVSGKLSSVLVKKRIKVDREKILKLAKKYKKNMSKTNLEKIKKKI